MLPIHSETRRATVGFVLAEEILWAGDHKSADKFKSMVTGDTIQVERKFGSCRQIPNRLKIIATSNHEHAVAAGVQDRRNVVFDVSDERAGDSAWFNRLYRDLENGGAAEFLNLLLNIRLGNWHPRQILKTTETIEQQRTRGHSRPPVRSLPTAALSSGWYGIDSCAAALSGLLSATLYFYIGELSEGALE